MTNAPIVLFVFNRPNHTKRVLESLKQNFLADQSLLYIMADGPKPEANDQEQEKIREVRRIIKSEAWCGEVIIHESESNKGLSGSIVPAVTDLLEKHGKLIVLEDDLILSRYALRYFNFSLNHFEKNEEINCIHGYSYPANYQADYFFMKGADCWGWATWKDRWEDFKTDGEQLLKKFDSKKLRYEFDFFDSYPFFDMLKGQVQGRNKSWAVKWYASSFIKNKLTLYPRIPYVINDGNDASGYHTTIHSDAFDNTLATAFDENSLKKLSTKENRAEKKRTSAFFSEKFLGKKEKAIFKLKRFFN